MKFHKNQLVGFTAFHVDRQTDRQTEGYGKTNS